MNRQDDKCQLTRDLIELVNREADLLVRDCGKRLFDGLRIRISNLFQQYMKTPIFNPAAATQLQVSSRFHRLVYSQTDVRCHLN
jgi:IQ and ubiquitin-like domain-containing protein